MNPDSCRDLICGSESDSLDIICKPIRIFLQNLMHLHSIPLIDLCCKLGRNSIFLQIDHGFSHILFFFHLRSDLHRLPFTDSLDLCEPFRFFFYNTECILPELFYDP